MCAQVSLYARTAGAAAIYIVLLPGIALPMHAQYDRLLCVTASPNVYVMHNERNNSHLACRQQRCRQQKGCKRVQTCRQLVTCEDQCTGTRTAVTVYLVCCRTRNTAVCRLRPQCLGLEDPANLRSYRSGKTRSLRIDGHFPQHRQS